MAQPTIELAEKPKRKYKRKVEPRGMPCSVVASLPNGKTIKIKGHRIIPEGAFLRVVTGYMQEERVNLNLCAHVKIHGIDLAIAAQPVPSFGIAQSVASGVVPPGATMLETGSVVYPRALDARPPETLPKARALPTGPNRPQPASVIENPNGTQEVVGAVMMPG